MLVLANGITLTFTLSDLLILTAIACLIVLTIYLVFTLKSFIRLLNESTTLVNESSKIVENVQEKTKVVEEYVTEAVSNGQGIFKALSLVNRVRR
ncbi:hypothetical protein [Turicibacter sp. TJ11]|uniref:hypothetical protein n=1 Tax=Turicibacter sp. TJ11 TaxID=2806443 RepID=UPI001F44F806|nr:hypothetical protein [Turicibacter sp. TJ11]